VKALLINCTLKASPEKSNTEALAEVVAEALRYEGAEVASVRAVDHSIPPGVESEMGEGDEWPGIRSQILDSEILLFATPTWLGRPSSIAQRVLERMDAMIAETDEDERPVAYKPRRATSGRTRPPGLLRRTSSRSPVRLRASRSRHRSGDRLESSFRVIQGKVPRSCPCRRVAKENISATVNPPTITAGSTVLQFS
jgi:hypothetical protein